MIIGIPKEIKDGERRVALQPEAVASLVTDGHTLCVQTNAGAGSGWPDSAYANAGATIVRTATEAYNVDLVVKVKEIQADEVQLVRPDSMLFCFLLLHRDAAVAAELIERRVSAIAFEAVTDANGHHPVLAPMSRIAGQLAMPIAANLLLAHQGGRGLLISDARVVVLGAGSSGCAAAILAQQMGATVTVISRPGPRSAALQKLLGPTAAVMAMSDETIKVALAGADVVIGAINSQVGSHQKLLSRANVASMGAGSVLIDIGIDRGGISDTCRESCHSAPTYVAEGVTHYCVANMPALVPRSASQAISNAVLPFVATLTGLGFANALRQDTGLFNGLHLFGGQICNAAIARQLGRACFDVEARLFTC